MNPLRPLSRLVDWLFNPVERPADADADFLQTAADLHELESRMRQLDRRRAPGGATAPV